MSTLEARLAALADTAFPPTPDIATSWATKLGSRPAKVAHRWRPPLLATLAGLLVAGGAATVAAIELIGPEDVTITRVQTLPPLPAVDPPNLGRKVGTLEEASALAGFTVLAHETPEEIRLDEFGVVTLIFDDVVISEAMGFGLEKVVGPQTEVRLLRVDGHRAVFFTGGPRQFHFPEPRLTDAPTLVVQRGQTIIRLEGAGLERAREIATALLRSPAP